MKNENPAAGGTADGAGSLALGGAGHQPNTTGAPPPGPAERLLALFTGHAGAHGTHGEPGPQDGAKWPIKKTAKTLREPVTLQTWQEHLDGKTALGVIPIRADNSCVWGSIDVDEYDGDLDPIQIISMIEKAKLPLVVCRSKSGGLHLFLFAAVPVPAAKMRAALRKLALHIGFEQCEIFPAQDTVGGGEDGLGNWMVMPYFGGTFGGKLKWQHGIKKTGADMSVEEFCTACEVGRIQPDKLAELLKRRQTRTGASAQPTGPSSEPAEPFGDGPPCLQTLAREGVKRGGQSNALLMMGTYYKKKDPDNWRGPLERANAEYLRPHGSPEGLDTVTRSLAKKDYEYTCDKQPMCGVCDRGVCQMRKFGVGGGGTPVIVSVRRVGSEDPVWFFTIEGSNGELEIEKVEDFTKYVNFTNQCAKQLNRIFMPTKPHVWASVLKSAFAGLIEEEENPEDTKFGRFAELLDEFLTNRQRGEQRSDVLSDRPWEDEDRGRHEFKKSALIKFLERQGIKEINSRKIGAYIKRLGGDRLGEGGNPVTVAGHSVRLWFVPSKNFREKPDIPPPTIVPSKF